MVYDDEELRKIFERYERLIFKAANNKSEESAYGYKNVFLKRVDKALVEFKKSAKRFINGMFPEVDYSDKAASLLKSYGAVFDAAKVTTYIQIVTALTSSAEQLRDSINDFINNTEKRGETVTIGKLRQYVTDKLTEGGAFAVEYSSGAKMPVGKYAAMLSTTSRVEAQNVSFLCKAIDEDIDLVEIPVFTPTCDLCAMYQGRIYSISGKTAGYPKLYDTVFKRGYSTIHPNCRHIVVPYKPQFHTAAERARLEEGTRRPFKQDSGNSHFNQLQSQRDEYARGQMMMRQYNRELNEFGEFQQAYKEKGIEPPYKTIGSFRRAFRSKEGSNAYAKSHYWRKYL